jgi:MscS family membrane protein
MDHLLDTIFLNNTVGSYLRVLGVIAFVLIIRHKVSKVLARLLFMLVAKASNTISREKFITLVVRPLEQFLLVFTIMATCEKLNYPQVLDFTIYRVSFKNIIEGFSVILLIITFIWLCLRVVEFVALVLTEKANLTTEQTDNQLIVFFKDFFKVLLVVIGLLMVWRFAFHQKLSNIVTSLSIVGAALALAFRESLENLIASFVIFFDRPFVTGDALKVHEVSGTVEKIGLRSTRIRTDQKTLVTVPNKQMVDSIVDNLTMRTQRKISFSLELHPATNAADTQAFVAAVGELLEKENGFESNHVWLDDISKKGFAVKLECLMDEPDIEKFNAKKQLLQLQVLQLMQNKRIQLAPIS